MRAAEGLFSEEVLSKIQRMRVGAHNGGTWPEGCYGSAASWLVFVGPSPGGGSKVSPDRERIADGGRPLWNTEFLDPVRKWSNGFNASMKPLVETIVGIPFHDGASKVYAVVNFHWQQNPDALYVPQHGIRGGAKDVMAVLSKIRPRVIVPMERRSEVQLQASLVEAGYTLETPGKITAHVEINGKGRAHRQMRGYRIGGKGALSGSIVVKSPQHPARIFNTGYALRCGRAIRSFALQLHARNDHINVQERA